MRCGSDRNLNNFSKLREICGILAVIRPCPEEKSELIRMFRAAQCWLSFCLVAVRLVICGTGRACGNTLARLV